MKRIYEKTFEQKPPPAHFTQDQPLDLSIRRIDTPLTVAPSTISQNASLSVRQGIRRTLSNPHLAEVNPFEQSDPLDLRVHRTPLQPTLQREVIIPMRRESRPREIRPCMEGGFLPRNSRQDIGEAPQELTFSSWESTFSTPSFSRSSLSTPFYSPSPSTISFHTSHLEISSPAGRANTLTEWVNLYWQQRTRMSTLDFFILNKLSADNVQIDYRTFKDAVDQAAPSEARREKYTACQQLADLFTKEKRIDPKLRCSDLLKRMNIFDDSFRRALNLAIKKAETHGGNTPKISSLEEAAEYYLDLWEQNGRKPDVRQFLKDYHLFGTRGYSQPRFNKLCEEMKQARRQTVPPHIPQLPLPQAETALHYPSHPSAAIREGQNTRSLLGQMNYFENSGRLHITPPLNRNALSENNLNTIPREEQIQVTPEKIAEEYFQATEKDSAASLSAYLRSKELFHLLKVPQFIERFTVHHIRLQKQQKKAFTSFSIEEAQPPLIDLRSPPHEPEVIKVQDISDEEEPNLSISQRNKLLNHFVKEFIEKEKRAHPGETVYEMDFHSNGKLWYKYGIPYDVFQSAVSATKALENVSLPQNMVSQPEQPIPSSAPARSTVSSATSHSLSQKSPSPRLVIEESHSVSPPSDIRSGVELELPPAASEAPFAWLPVYQEDDPLNLTKRGS